MKRLKWSRRYTYSQETPEIKKMTKITNDAIKSFLLAGDVIDRTPTVSAADPSACRKNDLRAYISDREGGRGGGRGSWEL